MLSRGTRPSNQSTWIFSRAFSRNPTIPRKPSAYPSQFLNSKLPFRELKNNPPTTRPGVRCLSTFPSIQDSTSAPPSPRGVFLAGSIRSLPSPGKQADQFLLPGRKEGSARLQSQETQTSSQPAGSGTWSQQEGPHASGKERKGKGGRLAPSSDPPPGGAGEASLAGLLSLTGCTSGQSLAQQDRRAGGRRSLLTQRRVGGGGERTRAQPRAPSARSGPAPAPALRARFPGHRTAQPRCCRAPARPAPCRGPGGGPSAPGARES